MAEFKLIKSILKGIASTLKDEDIRNFYADEVGKFVGSNSQLGKKWQSRVLDLLINSIYVPAKDGDSRGSNSYMNTFLAQIGIPLIELPKLREAYKLNGDKTPFSGFYVETGLALIPKGETFKNNSSLANKLNCSFKEMNIQLGNGRVPNFTQLMLLPDSEEGLIFRLNENADLSSIPNLKDYNWDFQGRSGLFRAYLGSGSYWGASDDGLEGSDSDGRVVRCDAEGVAPKKLEPQKDSIQERLDRFRNRL